jgi:hypothetical protein
MANSNAKTVAIPGIKSAIELALTSREKTMAKALKIKNNIKYTHLNMYEENYR